MSVFHSLAVVPIFSFNVALTLSDHFRIVSKQPLATSQNYQSLLPFKRKERLQHSLASSTLSDAFSPLQEHPQPYNYPEYQSNNRACCNHTIITNPTSRKNDYSSTYPNIITYPYFLMNRRIYFTQLIIWRIRIRIRCKYRAIRQCTVLSDGNIRGSYKHTLRVNIHIISAIYLPPPIFLTPWIETITLSESTQPRRFSIIL